VAYTFQEENSVILVNMFARDPRV